MTMLLGIDYGTTRTVVSAVYKGNYPITSFQNECGDMQDWYPSLIAARGRDLLFGFEAAGKQGEVGWAILGSLKRELAHRGPDSEVQLGSQSLTILELLTRFLSHLRQDLYGRSNLRIRKKARLEAMISVPANSNSNQRFITLEAFQQAGFHVRGMINEPSAAGIEYAHHHLDSDKSLKKECVAIYDLGGGTFDASIVNVASRHHEIVNSMGIGRLGGDDFDELLLGQALERARMATQDERVRSLLLQECRERKEGLHPNTRSMVIDFGRAIADAGEVVVKASDFYDACRPFVNRTINVLDEAVEAAEEDRGGWETIAAIYLVGGASNLPIVSRLLRQLHGRKVRKSPYPHAATAIGLAILADSAAGYGLLEHFTRHFGVWREVEDGRQVSFDVLFEKMTPLPAGSEEKIIRSRRYCPAHNIGHFRYLECGHTGVHGHPSGDITPWDEIFFPFDPSLESEGNLAQTPIERVDLSNQLIEERYICDSNGIIETTIINHTTSHSRSYRLRGQK
jgi:molecular chaperone DnaK (HSP70)